MALDSKTTGTSNVSRRAFLQRAAVLGTTTAGALSLTRGVHAAGSGVIKVGLIGCGGRGSGAAANAMNAGKDVRLVAVADVVPERTETARKLLKQKYPDQFVVDDAWVVAGEDRHQRLDDHLAPDFQPTQDGVLKPRFQDVDDQIRLGAIDDQIQ